MTQGDQRGPWKGIDECGSRPPGTEGGSRIFGLFRDCDVADLRPVTRSSTVGLLVELLLILLGLGTILGGDTNLALWFMAAWILLALGYVALMLWVAWRHRLTPDKEINQDPVFALPPWLVFLLGWTPVVAAFMGLLGGLIGLTTPQDVIDQVPEQLEIDEQTMLRSIQIVFGVMTVLMAVLGWLLLHLSYARHYERLDHMYGPAIRFPGTADPVTTDYVYFALTLGTTFATSDATVTSRRLRWTTTVHSVLSLLLQRHRHGHRIQESSRADRCRHRPVRNCDLVTGLVGYRLPRSAAR